MKIEKLNEEQKIEAEALYRHLLNHEEVQFAPIKPGEPMCKICGKTAKEIAKREKTLSDYIIKSHNFHGDLPPVIPTDKVKQYIKEFIETDMELYITKLSPISNKVDQEEWNEFVYVKAKKRFGEELI